MASIAAFVYFWSSAYEVSGGCATDTLYPSFLRILATGSQPEPSAKAPCTRTTFLIVIVVLLFAFEFFSDRSASRNPGPSTQSLFGMQANLGLVRLRDSATGR